MSMTRVSRNEKIEEEEEEEMGKRVLNDDVVEEILRRLPSKCLVRYRCVCKKWYRLIGSPGFIMGHVKQSKEDKSYRVLLRSYNELEKRVSYKVCYDNENLDEIMSIEFPYVSQSNDFYRMVGCVNGVVCLSDDIVEPTDTLILWNPVIRRVLNLPKPELLSSTQFDFGRSVFGFGFDCYNKDYKVIRIVYRKNPDFEARNVEAAIAIYRLSTCCWQEKGCCLVPLLDTRQAYVKGIIHWLAYNKLMVGFDVKKEAFKEMKLPNSVENANISDLTIASWCEKLSVFENGYWSGRLCLWVMKEYGEPKSWAKQFEIQAYAMVRSLRRNGSVILENIGGKLVLYDTKRNQLKEYKTHVKGSIRGFHMKSYLESLVLLDRRDVHCVP